MFIFPTERALIDKAIEWAANKIAFYDREITKLTSQKSQVRRRHVEARAAYADMHYLLSHSVIRTEEPADEAAS